MLRKVILGEKFFILQGKAVSQQSVGYLIAGKTSLSQRRDVFSCSYYRHLSAPTLRSKDAADMGKEILREGKVSAVVE